jgi:hypothetical protein
MSRKNSLFSDILTLEEELCSDVTSYPGMDNWHKTVLVQIEVSVIK